ncbi:MAG: hypothetical protein MZV64_10610 [Ignavibacteriales bacterium]|nr:hypothetical protein [Ignavibacteriales bacterium]
MRQPGPLPRATSRISRRTEELGTPSQSRRGYPGIGSRTGYTSPSGS